MKYFKESDFECKCGCGEMPGMGIMVFVNMIRNFAGEPMIVTTGKRCVRHNANEGGKKKSKHLAGTACDIRFLKNNTPERIKTLRKKLEVLFPDECGIGKYKSFIHIDIRKKKTRW